MDQGMIAFWYDLSDSGQSEYLSWLHEVHLPEVLAGREDLLWAAHFHNEGGGERFHEVVKDMMRSGKDEVGSGREYLLLIGAESPYSFFNPNFPQIKERQSGETKEMVGLREGLNLCVFSEEKRVDGPDAGLRPAGTAPGNYIQMGNFNVAKPDDGHVLGGWYAQERLPFMQKMPGCIGARKLTASVGWGKHSILYEFASSKARDDNFIAHEEEGFVENSWTAKVHEFVIHAPCSPFVGPRLWPPVE